MKHRLAQLGLFVMAAIVTLLPVSEALAQPAPDSTPTVNSITVYRNLLESGDSIYLIDATIPYAVIPSNPEPTAFIWQLIALDGVTVLGSTTGFAYNQSGYNRNIYSMYFPSATGLAWGAAYTVRLVGTPIGFPTGYTPGNHIVPVSSYTSLTSTTDNQTALAAWVISEAQTLNIAWGLSSSFYLTTQTDTGTVLSHFGQLVFGNSIVGLQAMAPTAYLTQFGNVELINRNFGDNYSLTLHNQWTGTWVATAIQGMVDFFGTGWDLADLLMLLVVCGIVFVGNIMITGDAMNGLMDVIVVMIGATRLGVFPLAIFSLIGVVCIIYLGTVLFGRMIPR